MPKMNKRRNLIGDIIGQVFGRLTVIAKADIKNKQPRFVCQCECDGKTVIVPGWNLKSGHTKSCGCLKIEQLIERSTVHGSTGLSRTQKQKCIYASWSNMLQRCFDPNYTNFKYWGGRGIQVCVQWTFFHLFYRDVEELKLARLQTAERNLGSAGAVLNRKELAELESQAVQLETDIRSISEEERAIFARGTVTDVQAGRRLSDIRPRREVKEAKLKTILDRLASQRGGLRARASEAGEEAQRQLESLVKRLIRKREQAALRLLGYLCDEDDRHRWEPYAMDFKSVSEAVRLRRFSCSDSSEAHALLEQIRTMWETEPLAELLRVCEKPGDAPV